MLFLGALLVFETLLSFTLLPGALLVFGALLPSVLFLGALLVFETLLSFTLLPGALLVVFGASLPSALFPGALVDFGSLLLSPPLAPLIVEDTEVEDGWSGGNVKGFELLGISGGIFACWLRGNGVGAGMHWKAAPPSKNTHESRNPSLTSTIPIFIVFQPEMIGPIAFRPLVNPSGSKFTKAA